jgi:methylmalonyl-CoA carboxyltransferase 5S subunit
LAVERFVEKSAGNGIDVFRVFDAVNDPRNLQTSIAAVKKTVKHAQGAICYTVSPLHTVEAFAEMAEQLREMGCDSIRIKDMATLRSSDACRYRAVQPCFFSSTRRFWARPSSLPLSAMGCVLP